MDLVDVVVKGDEFLEEDLDQAFNQTKTTKSEYIDAELINKFY